VTLRLQLQRNSLSQTKLALPVLSKRMQQMINVMKDKKRQNENE
jgi:hypothetical protein